MTYPKVSIIILNWNGLEDTIECLESLKGITYPNYDVIVVDNGSEGNDAEVLRERFGDYIHLIENDRNYGFAQGNNIGAGYALENLNPEYILILNNDTVVDAHFLTELVQVAQSDPGIAIVGGKIYLYGTNRFDSAGSLFNNVGICTSRANLEEDKGQYDMQEEVPLITACCCLVRKKVLERTYLFDPDFFLYYEELDLNIRVRKLGYKVVYVPRSVIYHKYSQSVKGKTARQTLLVKRFYGNINRAKVLVRHYPAKVLMQNLHLILLSYLYYNYECYFSLRAGIFWIMNFNYHVVKSLPPAFVERWKQKVSNPGWVSWMDYYGFRDYLRLIRASGKQWEERMRRLHPE